MADGVVRKLRGNVFQHLHGGTTYFILAHHACACEYEKLSIQKRDETIKIKPDLWIIQTDECKRAILHTKNK